MRRTVATTITGTRILRRRSLTRRLSYDEKLPAHLADMLWQGDADRLLYASVPLQVKDRCAVARHDGAGGPLLVKRHTWGGLWRTIRLSWRESASRYCARVAWHLADHGIPTPRPLAILEQCIGPFGYRSYLVTDYVEGTDLYRFIRYGEPTSAELRHVALQVAAIWQRLVELGISHNDTKPENFIVDEDLGVWLIDFEKLRLRGKPGRQRQRQIADVKNFLHVRSWHRQAVARQVFHEAFLQTPFGEWLTESVVDPSSENDANLSVLILCNDAADCSPPSSAIDSVRDIADDIVLLAPRVGSRVDVVSRIEPCGPVERRPEWVLLLHSDESVSPFLAKELKQRIADPRAADAFRLPIDRQYFGQVMPRASGADAEPIRLFQRERCSYSLASGRLAISVDPQRTETLSGSIEKCVASSVAEFVVELNERTTRAATRRLQDGQRPRLGRAVLRAFRKFAAMYFWRGGIRTGWAGLQIAFLEAAFLWLEEGKLRAMLYEFDRGASASPVAADTALPTTESRAAAPVSHTKAA